MLVHQSRGARGSPWFRAEVVESCGPTGRRFEEEVVPDRSIAVVGQGELEGGRIERVHGDDAVIQREPSFRKWGDDEAQVVGIRDAVVNIKPGQRDEVGPWLGACLMDHGDGHVVFTTAFEGEIRKRQTDVPARREAVRCPNRHAGRKGGVGAQEGGVGEGDVP